MTEFLKIGSGPLRAEISPFGAALARVWVDGHDTSLVLGRERGADYLNDPQAIGVVVGPVAGRISEGRFALGDTSFQMSQNEGGNALHSGPDGVQNQIWQIEAQNENMVTLALELPDGKCGLPGHRSVRATYEAQEADLTLTLEATSDQDTPVNLTSHAYWVLDASGGLEHHKLTLPTTRMIEMGADLIPTGKIAEMSGTAFDFKSIAQSPVGQSPLDGCFCISEAPSADLQHFLELTSEQSGISLTVASNQPGVVLYTGAGLPTVETPANTPQIAPFAGLAIETQGWPDAPNQPKFPSILLKSGNILKQITRFSVKTP